MINHEVVARRSGKWWFLKVPGLRFCATQARRLSEADGMAREVIAMQTDTAEDSFTITLRVEPGRLNNEGKQDRNFLVRYAVTGPDYATAANPVGVAA
ncbi:hypothetical protein Aph02nite_27830 [Actinoplanes philippinensis]|uniref:Uncharacterized protein n=1 Tax=Actinoplanes philippinensis TaxID=35752 RepID=A0A1I2GEC2_9ACTN|nr:hypothetical protein [Actinoplanes philippinensis]GIE76833.1 hypothetical protein Aph02nite_27830 [Actinoplanes philippinensis]SFF15257.1 hypothetical protein SAMN05421541_106438 [Actinoplanes philippinensis]